MVEVTLKLYYATPTDAIFSLNSIECALDQVVANKQPSSEILDLFSDVVGYESGKIKERKD